jgi:nucleotide-binding universal stress UspA family protein
MDTDQRVLFSIDDSDFARQAIAAIGNLLKGCDTYRITVYYGAPDPNLSFLSTVLNLGPEAVKEYEKFCSIEEQKVLERAKDALVASGLGANGVATICESKCNDPVGSLLNFADSQSIETLAVARLGHPVADRKALSSAAYRLVHASENHPVWVIDPRISSHDVLVALVGAPISRRVMEYTVRSFAYLKNSRFTFFHVLPPLPPQYWDHARILHAQEREDRQQKIDQWMKEYIERVQEVAEDGKKRLIDAGVPEENVIFKVQVQERGIARDILAELEEHNHGILVMGRKGFRGISQFTLGSKADKLLHTAHALAICLVN